MPGTFQKMPKNMQEHLKKDSLIVRGYNKGIAFKGEKFYDKEANSWISDVYDFDARNSMRIRLSINWQTLRYKKSAVARFGKCEDVSTKVNQTAGTRE